MAPKTPYPARGPSSPFYILYSAMTTQLYLSDPQILVDRASLNSQPPCFQLHSGRSDELFCMTSCCVLQSRTRPHSVKFSVSFSLTIGKDLLSAVGQKRRICLALASLKYNGPGLPLYSHISNVQFQPEIGYFLAFSSIFLSVYDAESTIHAKIWRERKLHRIKVVTIIITSFRTIEITKYFFSGKNA